jgi:hypothetical protein
MSKATVLLKRRVPRSALTLNGGRVEFATAGENSGGSPGAAEPRPVALLCRTDQPASHPYFGRIVHDMAGFSSVAERTPLDYCHDPQHVLGFAEEYDPDGEDGLTASAQVVPTGQEHDMGARVLALADKGVPFQCSISHAPGSIVMEDVPDGMSTQVNGYTFTGPGTVFRKWCVSGVALCPYGIDNQTSAQFSDKSETVEVSYLSKEPIAMSEPTIVIPAAATPAAIPATPAAPLAVAAPAAAAAAPLAATPATPPGQKYLDAFGDQGGIWFAQGKTFDECQALYLSAVKAQNEQLKTRLASIAGEGELPLSFTPAVEPAVGASGAASGGVAASGELNRLEMALGPNLARVAMAIKIPPKP